MFENINWLDISCWFVGFFYSIVIGGLVISRIHHLNHLSLYKEKKYPMVWRVQVVGFIERALFTSSWLVGMPEFVAIWLALKIANRWEIFKYEFDNKNYFFQDNKKHMVSSLFESFLIGNGLSISFGIIGGLLITQMLQREWGMAIIIGFSLPIASGFLYLFMARKIYDAFNTKIKKEHQEKE
jgi:hypothetical protein